MGEVRQERGYYCRDGYRFREELSDWRITREFSRPNGERTQVEQARVLTAYMHLDPRTGEIDHIDGTTALMERYVGQDDDGQALEQASFYCTEYHDTLGFLCWLTVFEQAAPAELRTEIGQRCARAEIRIEDRRGC